MNFDLSPQEATAEIGDAAKTRLVQLARWLTGGKGALYKYRIAPSIITRGEAELFGISSPRFAIRGRLDGLGFANIRRLHHFYESASRQTKISRRRLKRLTILSGQCIADSLLRFVWQPKLDGRMDRDLGQKNRSKREWHSGSYVVLTAELETAYGEQPIQCQASPKNVGTLTPFLQHMQLGGGLCAQAACFMVLCLYEWAAREICGTAEITSIAAGSFNRADELFLSGLTVTQAMSFFESDRIGLTCHYQGSGKLTSSCLAAMAMRCYLLSHVPLMIPVDQSKLDEPLPGGGKSIISQTKSEYIATLRLESEDHLVVAVGCDMKNDRFLLNDPSSLPFLRATCKELDWVKALRDFRFVSVVPEPVKVALLNSFSHNVQQLGLLGEVKRWFKREGATEFAPPLSYYADAIDKSVATFRLAELSSRAPADAARRRKALGDDLALLLETTLPTLGIVANWCWVQSIDGSDKKGTTERSIWLWDATRPFRALPLDKSPVEANPRLFTEVVEDVANHLVAVLGFKDGQWSEVRRLTPAGANSEAVRSAIKSVSEDGFARQQRTVSRSLEFKPALLTSFCAKGVLSRSTASQKALAVYPCQKIDGELYLCMSGDIRRVEQVGKRSIKMVLYENLRRLFLRKSSTTRITAVEFLAELQENDGALLKFARDISDSFDSLKQRIVAIASFVPEVSRFNSGPSNNVALKAIAALLRIADQLQDHGHPTEVLEVVGGSRILGIRRVKQVASGFASTARATAHTKVRSEARTMPGFAAEFIKQSEALGNLVTALKESIKIALPHLRHRIKIATELEPGDYFVVRDWPTLCELAQELQTLNRSLPDQVRVGLNLDVSHWRLARIKLEQLQGTDDHARLIRELITHVHLSGHHPNGHFGDSELEPTTDMQDWLAAAGDMPNLGRGQNGQDRYVSLEFEAARNCEVVTRSCDALKALINAGEKGGVT